MKYKVTYAPESEIEFRELRAYIRKISGSRRVATSYLKRLRAFCRELSYAPHRGEEPFTNQTGLRTVGFERDISVMFRIKEEQRTVEVVGIFDHGRSLERARERDF